MNSIIMWLLVVGLGLLALILLLIGIYFLMRMLVNRLLDEAVKLLFTEPYSGNLWEGVTAVRHAGAQHIMENELRTAGQMELKKPIGGANKFPHFDGLLLNTGQLWRHPLPRTGQVSLTTFLGKQARRPMQVSMPVMAAAMGYGVALSKAYSLALARGTGMVQTSFNTGEGPVLPEHRMLAYRLVVQAHGGQWFPSDEDLAQADMVEIPLGQGSSTGLGNFIDKEKLRPEVLQDMGFSPSEQSGLYYKPSVLEKIHHPRDLKKMVDTLRKKSHGAPIAVKLAANALLEKDLEIVAEAGADVIVLDGAQAGTHESTAVLVDDFGLPTLHALVRSVRFLEKNGLSGDIDLIISGGLQTPGDVLKALCLGASGVNMASPLLFAAMFDQIVKALPYEPPTQLAWSTGALQDDFDEERGTESLYRFLVNFAEEVKVGMLALGKASVEELGPEDLIAWDPEVSRITGIPLG